MAYRTLTHISRITFSPKMEFVQEHKKLMTKFLIYKKKPYFLTHFPNLLKIWLCYNFIWTSGTMLNFWKKLMIQFQECRHMEVTEGWTDSTTGGCVNLHFQAWMTYILPDMQASTQNSLNGLYVLLCHWKIMRKPEYDINNAFQCQ